MTDLDYKLLYCKETNVTFGIKILAAGFDVEVLMAARDVANQAAEDIEDILQREVAKRDPENQKHKAEEREKLFGLFRKEQFFWEEIPNQYCSRWCCSQRPWYCVPTHKGTITLGWRKRVIQIGWDPQFAGQAEALFPNENVTKFDGVNGSVDTFIHAWSYEKAQEYIDRILA